MTLTSAKNPHIQHLCSLRKPSARQEYNQCIIEGYREILRAMQANWPLLIIYYCPELFLGKNERTIIEKSGAKAIEISSALFHKISYRDRPDGLIVLAEQQHRTYADFALSDHPVLLIAESIEKPGNLGSILRSCDATGVDGVIVCDKTTDIYNPNVIRSSVGTLFTQTVIEASSDQTLTWLRDNHIAIVAATPAADTLYTDADLTGPIAIVVGTEQLGLSPQWMENADIQVRIPMRGHSDSLNVAAATTLLLYEALRQRSG